MKRNTAWKYLHTLCERFDEAVTSPEKYPIPILRVWLYGSVLTEKPEPGNINLIVEVDSSAYCQTYRSTALSLQEILKNYHRALARYHTGMVKIRMADLEVGQGEPGWWFQIHGWPENTPYYLIWQQGMNWKDILAAIQADALPYNPTIEAERKRENIEANGIMKVGPVMRLIRTKYHLMKFIHTGAIYYPLRTRVGFRIHITSDCCPFNLKPFLQGRLTTDLGLLKRTYACVAVIRWVWGAPPGDRTGQSVNGAEATILEPFIDSTDARQWVSENMEKLFREAGMDPIPIQFIAEGA
jgi:hypothetical protein